MYAVEQTRYVSEQHALTNGHYQSNITYFDEQKEAQLLLEVEIKQGSSFIQPEGITNVCSEITFKAQCKEASYKIDIGDLINESNNGVKLMNYHLDQIKVHIIDLNNSMILPKSAYIMEPIVDNQIKIYFTNLVIEERSAYKIIIYIPTTIGRQVIYGGSGTSSYLNKYIQNKRIGTVKAIVEAYSQIDEVLNENDQVIKQYSDKKLLKEQVISLRYMEIPKIY